METDVLGASTADGAALELILVAPTVMVASAAAAVVAASVALVHQPVAAQAMGALGADSHSRTNPPKPDTEYLLVH